MVSRGRASPDLLERLTVRAEAVAYAKGRRCRKGPPLSDHSGGAAQRPMVMRCAPASASIARVGSAPERAATASSASVSSGAIAGIVFSATGYVVRSDTKFSIILKYILGFIPIDTGYLLTNLGY